MRTKITKERLTKFYREWAKAMRRMKGMLLEAKRQKRFNRKIAASNLKSEFYHET